MSSILSLLPVLTGKTQNIRLIASRIYPASLVIAGIGAGRVLLKLQLGLLLCSFELYRNIVSDLSYAHDEYVNRFAPSLHHLPTGTPERHASGVIRNHNYSETYMVEAWFQNQGEHSVVKLKRNNWMRVVVGCTFYIVLCSVETFLSLENVATGTSNVYIALQAGSVASWIVAISVAQHQRGDGVPEVDLNRKDDSEYRCFIVPMLGQHVKSEVFSFKQIHVQNFQLFSAGYSHPLLTLAGILVLVSGLIDIMSTILIVGLTSWAYYWIVFEILVIIAKAVFCLEPLRPIELDLPEGHHLSTGRIANQQYRLPVVIELEQGLVCEGVYEDGVLLRDLNSKIAWKSHSAGVWIGQMFTEFDETGNENKATRYLALNGQSVLHLIENKPQLQQNQALQREFLAALATLVEANKVPSTVFLQTVERTIENMRTHMTEKWHNYGAKDVLEMISRAKASLLWRKFF